MHTHGVTIAEKITKNVEEESSEDKDDDNVPLSELVKDVVPKKVAAVMVDAKPKGDDPSDCNSSVSSGPTNPDNCSMYHAGIVQDFIAIGTKV